jgi:hypothetical protein
MPSLPNAPASASNLAQQRRNKASLLLYARGFVAASVLLLCTTVVWTAGYFIDRKGMEGGGARSLGSYDSFEPSPDGALLIRLRGDISSNQQAHILESWDMQAKRLGGRVNFGRHVWFGNMEWNMDGSRLAAVMHVDGEKRVVPRIAIFDATSLKLIAAIPLSDDRRMTHFHISPDGTHLLALNGGARLIDLRIGRVVDSLLADSTYWVQDGAFEADGTPVLLLETERNLACCTMDGLPRVSIPFPDQWHATTSIALTRDAAAIGIADTTGMSMYDACDGRLLQRIDFHRSLHAWTRLWPDLPSLALDGSALPIASMLPAPDSKAATCTQRQ